MKQADIIKYGILHAIIAGLYVGAVASLMTNAETLFGPVGDSVLSGVAFLLTFVLSAAVMGITLFGRPILWYLNGSKKEAMALVFYTLVALFLITAIVFLALIYCF